MSKKPTIIDLARLAYSGDDMLSSTHDHEGVEFKNYAAFMFTAIKPPRLPATDMEESVR